MTSGLPDYTKKVSIVSISVSVPVTQSGTWNIATVTTVTGITNTVSVNVTNVSIAVTASQTGTWNIATVTTVTGITNTVNVNVANVSVAVTQSGTWNIGTVTTVTGITNTVSVNVTNVSVAVTQSGTWNIGTVTTVTAVTGITNTVNVSVQNASVAVTQSGTWNIATVTTVTGISNTVNVSVQNASVAVTQSGTWNIATVTTVTGITNTVSVNVTNTINIGTVTGIVTISGNVTIQNANLNVTVGNTVIATGQTGPAVGFNGDGYISVSHHADLTVTSEDFTIILDFKMRSLNPAHAILWGKGALAVDGTEVVMWYDNNFLRVFTNQSGTFQESNLPSGAIALNTRYRMVIARSGATITIFLNGVDATSMHGSHINPTTNTRNLTIGKGDDYGLFDGIVYADLFYKGKAFTQTEVTEDFNNPQSPIMSGLKMWHKLDEGTGTTAKDSSGLGHDGTLTSCIWLSAQGAVGSAVAVNISASQVTLNVAVANTVTITGAVSITGGVTVSGDVNITNATIDVLAPTGKMVSSGETVATESYNSSAQAYSSGVELSLLTVTGRGKLITVGFQIIGTDTSTDCGATLLRVYIDGSKVFELPILYLDILLNGGAINNQATTVDTKYYANVTNPRGGLTVGRTHHTDISLWNRLGGFLNIPFEYTTSMAVKVYNSAVGGTIQAIIAYGAYV